MHLYLRLSGKTTLLFNYAVNAASRGLRCVLLTRREAVELNPPLLAPDSAPAGTLSRIDMKYLHSEEELVKWCASLHLMSALPHVILLDGLTALLDAPGQRDSHGAAGLPPREVRLARCLALLTDAVQFAAGRAQTGTPPRGCQLIISDRSSDGGDSPPLWFVWRRWTPLVLTCRTVGASYHLGVLPTDTGPRCRTALRYSRTATALVAEGLVRPDG